MSESNHASNQVEHWLAELQVLKRATRAATSSWNRTTSRRIRDKVAIQQQQVLEQARIQLAARSRRS